MGALALLNLACAIFNYSLDNHVMGTVSLVVAVMCGTLWLLDKGPV